MGNTRQSNAFITTLKGCAFAILLPVFWLLFNTGVFSSNVEAPKSNIHPWPPVVGQAYPDMTLIDQDGERFKLSYLKGKVIIIEPTGMNCPACQAFSGGHQYGAYENNPVEQYSKSFRKIFPQYSGGVRLPSKDIVLVQLLLYNMNMGQPTVEDARKWASHFNLHKGHNHFVAVSPLDLRSKASFDMIPGFQLIDQNFILRADSTGHHPKHDLYRQLIPLAGKLAQKP